MPGRIVASGDARLEREIVLDGQARDQVELLKHQAEPVAPQCGAAGIGQLGRRSASVEPDLAAIGGDRARRSDAAACSCRCRIRRSARRSRRRRRSRFTPRSTATCFAGGAVALGQVGDAQHDGVAVGHAQAMAMPHSGFWYFSTNSSVGTCGRNTAASRGSSGWRRKSPSATSLKPAASISCAQHALLDPVQRLGDADAVARLARNGRR